MRIQLFLFLFLMSIFSVAAQTTVSNSKIKNKLKFTTSYNFGALKNLEIAPVSRYDYTGLIYKIGYERITKKKNLFNIEFDYLESTLETDVIPVLNLGYTKLGLGISYVKNIYNDDNFSIHLGLKSNSNISTYSMRNGERNLFSQSFSLASIFNYRINEKHSLFSELSVPFIFFRSTHATSGIYSLKEYQGLSWSFGYKYSPSEQFDFTFNYNLNYERLQITSAFREVQQQLGFGIIFKF